KKFNLPIRAVVMPSDEWLKDAVVAFAVARARSEPPESSIHISTTDGKELQLSDLDPATREKLLQAHRPAAASIPAKIAEMGEKGKVALREDYRGDPAQYSAFEGDGIAINSDVINGLRTPEAKERIIALLEREGTGHRTINFKLRDWLFS